MNPAVKAKCGAAHVSWYFRPESAPLLLYFILSVDAITASMCTVGSNSNGAARRVLNYISLGAREIKTYVNMHVTSIPPRIYTRPVFGVTPDSVHRSTIRVCRRTKWRWLDASATHGHPTKGEYILQSMSNHRVKDHISCRACLCYSSDTPDPSFWEAPNEAGGSIYDSSIQYTLHMRRNQGRNDASTLPTALSQLECANPQFSYYPAGARSAHRVRFSMVKPYECSTVSRPTRITCGPAQAAPISMPLGLTVCTYPS